MEYISTRNTQKIFSFKDVFLKGLAPDGGLFVPKKIPLYTSQELEKLRNLSYNELAAKIILKFCSDEFNETEIKDLVNDSYKNFRVKDVVAIKKLGKINLLELFHGPTLAFKDYALQVVGNLFEHVLKKEKKRITIIGATSGDTGSAAINACKNKSTMELFIFHPYKKVSNIQRRLMTTVKSNNIYNIAIKGNFDDCQKIVKKLFVDQDLKNKFYFSAINSINWARILFQLIYYFYHINSIARSLLQKY